MGLLVQWADAGANAGAVSDHQESSILRLLAAIHVSALLLLHVRRWPLLVPGHYGLLRVAVPARIHAV